MINDLLNSKLVLGCLTAIPLILAAKKKRKLLFRLFIPTYVTTISLHAIIKRLTAIPRPFIQQPQVLGISVNIPSDYSFPSGHTIIATLFAWVLATIAPSLSWIGFAIMLIISASRVYLGVHYGRDITAGFLLATAIYWFFFLLICGKKALRKDYNPNLRRKLIHLFYGFALVGLLSLNILNTPLLGLICAIIAIFVFVLSRQQSSIIRKIITYFERKKNPRFPGLGPLFFTTSSFLALLLFSKPIALAAILNLTVGDSVNALIGYFWKKDKKKKIGITAAAFFATSLMTLQYVNPQQAIIGALSTSILEFTEPKIKGKEVDDNLLIPLLSGSLMSLL